MTASRLARRIWILAVALTVAGHRRAGRGPTAPQPDRLALLGGSGRAALEEPLLGWSTYALVTEPGSLPGGAATALVATLPVAPKAAR